MLRILLIIGFILSTNLTLATNNIVSIDDDNSPSALALNVFRNAISSVQDLKTKQQINAQNIRSLIKAELLPHIAVKVSTKLTLKKYWSSLNEQQKQIFQNYIVESLIKDYSGAFASYNKFDRVRVSADPNVKRKDNKAIVKLFINLEDNPKPITVSLKMIYSNKWRVYDVVFSGVSIIKTYKAQFSSHIKRKGVDSLINKLSEKLAEI